MKPFWGIKKKRENKKVVFFPLIEDWDVKG